MASRWHDIQVHRSKNATLCRLWPSGSHCNAVLASKDVSEALRQLKGYHIMAPRRRCQ